MLDCTKLRVEHMNSRYQTYQSLSKLGIISAEPIKVLDLNHLRHLLTSFHVKPLKSVSVACCLQSVFPTGANPVAEGLDKICELEREPRGAYYGLVGIVEPGGNFCFSQVLRTIFTEPTLGNYAYAGAAVIAESDPLEEFLETQLKLSSIQIALKSP